MSLARIRPWVLVGLLCLGVLAVPCAGFAHGRIHVGIGPGWWAPFWGYPAPWPYYYGPPVHVPGPPPCREVWVEGRWERVAKEHAWGFITYRERWVPGHWEQICP